MSMECVVMKILAVSEVEGFFGVCGIGFSDDVEIYKCRTRSWGHLKAPFPVAVSHRIGVRPVIVTGGILSGLGLAIASQSHSVPVLAVAMVALAGTGAACVKEPLFSQMALYFHEKYAFVSFLAKMGAPFGMMVYGPATQALTEYYGWRGALLILAGLSFNLTVCGLLICRSSSSRFKRAPSVALRMSDYQDLDRLDEENRRLYYCCSQLISTMGLAVFKDVRFILITMIKLFSGFGYAGIVIYMVPNALSLGLDAHQSSFDTTAWGIGNLLGLSFATLVMHTKVLSECSVMGIGTSLAVVGYVLDPFIASFVGQMIVTAIIGAGTESLFLVSIILTRYLTNTDNRVVFLYTWQNFITGLSYPVSGFVSGYLFEITGDFKVTFFVFSGTMLLTGISIILYYVYTNYKKSAK
ncbi:monocarboxylate transporter 12-like [Asterias amurensis]|uniref:monocarboxylate transporter 12-like n=1 Tax=Asterias amurensis TaxID=7602 RepID=UPI003AB33E99